MLQLGQKWISKEYPHEDFEIYGGTESMYEWLWFWERINKQAFDEYIVKKKGSTPEELTKQGRNTYPYAWTGECSGANLKTKIKKYNMVLKIETEGSDVDESKSEIVS
ncbi:hypothetical protein [Paenibacillus polymyxa]|uniref:Uncharacterized protein n=1 Tax=Paenibacillus polymyxa TaxID=1406 RepID=A0ABX2ZA72_PAEPO|nr:hypothetical protein [Paenibacillus polymyxa]ODA08220.1 hypothetical protein A7312_28055 [Paenibacillus polymyxa]